MKKVIALLLSVVMIMSMSVTAFAADTEVSGNGSTAQSTVVYTEASSYILVIPEYIIPGPYQYCTIEAKSLNLKAGDELLVRLTNLDENDNLTLTHSSGSTIDVHFGVFDDYDTCAKFYYDSQQTINSVSCEVVGTATTIPAGEYTGIAEFVVVFNG